MKEKVFAYIIRKVSEATEILIFTQKGFPEAGIQVPAGTIEKGESRKDALNREVKEESGLSNFSGIHFLGKKKYVSELKGEIHIRYFYQLNYQGESLSKFEHQVDGNGVDSNMVFSFKWVNIKKIPKLIAGHDQYISKIIG